MALGSGAWAEAAEEQSAASNGAVFRRTRMVSFSISRASSVAPGQPPWSGAGSPRGGRRILPLAAEDEAQELAQLRLEWPAGRTAGCNLAKPCSHSFTRPPRPEPKLRIVPLTATCGW